jgi:hypothetical protein
MPVITALQSRIAELSDELRHQGSALAAAQKEKARLAEVEADLGRTIQSLRSELTALQQKHSDELLAVSTANDGLRAERDDAVAAQAAMRAERDEARAARDGFRQDRDEHIAKYEELEKEATRLRRRAKAYCDTMEEMDTLLSGKTLLTPIAPFDCQLLFVLTLVFHFELQRPGLSPKKPLTPPLPEIEMRGLLPGAPSKRRPTSGPGMNT